MSAQKLTVFGPNLRDQSKGQFVVHAHDCADCAKLAHEDHFTGNWYSLNELATELYLDQITEGSVTKVEAKREIHCAPCVIFG